jgi:hypothetical protein
VGQRVLRRMWKRVPFCVLIEGESWERMMLLLGEDYKDMCCCDTRLAVPTQVRKECLKPQVRKNV